jgi:ATPase subunit of ABC transporter with duplicated ATPase domains
MLTRLYIDNFRCFVGFEYKPGRTNLILGRNGSGKSSMLDALLFVRQFVAVGSTAEELFPLNQRTRWHRRSDQIFELEATINGGNYLYQLAIEPSDDPPRAVVASERISMNQTPLLVFENGEVQLYDDGEIQFTYPLERDRSSLLTVSTEKKSLIAPFKKWLASVYSFRLNPFSMGLRAEGENLYPNVNLSNIASWYRHLLQDDPRENQELLASLREAIDGFNFLELEFAGESVRLLVADFERQGGTVKVGFTELSDGQRCLICLYMILHFVAAKGNTVIIDEPENFISLAEIQPWLMKLIDLVEDRKGQAILISHHPEVINQLAPSYGVQFVRSDAGTVRVEPFHGDPDSSLPPAELVARGWERG